VCMVQERIVYENNGFTILECDRVKQYDLKILNDNDKVYRIKINGVNQPTFDDLCEAIYYLLKNKVFDHAFLHYKDKVLDAINRAEVERKKEKISENNHSDLLSDYF